MDAGSVVTLPARTSAMCVTIYSRFVAADHHHANGVEGDRCSGVHRCCFARVADGVAVRVATNCSLLVAAEFCVVGAMRFPAAANAESVYEWCVRCLLVIPIHPAPLKKSLRR